MFQEVPGRRRVNQRREKCTGTTTNANCPPFADAGPRGGRRGVGCAHSSTWIHHRRHSSQLPVSTVALRPRALGFAAVIASEALRTLAARLLRSTARLAAGRPCCLLLRCRCCICFRWFKRFRWLAGRYVGDGLPHGTGDAGRHDGGPRSHSAGKREEPPSPRGRQRCSADLPADRPTDRPA